MATQAALDVYYGLTNYTQLKRAPRELPIMVSARWLLQLPQASVVMFAGACPAVAFNTENVTIGEDNNTVRLTHAQWNDLVSRIQKGELTRVE